MTLQMSVVICSLNGAPGVARCLLALGEQTMASELQLIVVDDGSSDGTDVVARDLGAVVVRHEVNRGLAAARNSGVAVADAPIVAFLDDDCEPTPSWAERLVECYSDPTVVGAGGGVDPVGPDSWAVRYVIRNNPLRPLELDAIEHRTLRDRIRRYVMPQSPEAVDPRVVASLVGANMSFRTEALKLVGGFDERFTFGAEEFEACLRVRDRHPTSTLAVSEQARVWHHFEPGMKDVVRRSRSYGLGAARLSAVRRAVPLSVLPLPFVVAGLAALGTRRRPFLALAALAPLGFYRASIKDAVAAIDLEPLADPYVHLAREAAADVGVAQGCLRFRALRRESRRGVAEC